MDNDNPNVKNAQKQNKANAKTRYKSLVASKKSAGSKGISKPKFATKSAEGTVGGGKIAKTKTTITKQPIRYAKDSGMSRFSSKSDNKTSKAKTVKIKKEVETGKFETKKIKKIPNYKG